MLKFVDFQLFMALVLGDPEICKRHFSDDIMK